MKAWCQPKYQYMHTTTLLSCVRAFLDANGWRKEEIASDIGCGIDQIERWLANEFTVGLTTRYKRRFEGVTGIDLERLYVIRAKNQILEMLGDTKRVRTESPLLANLLERDEQLSDKIDFSALETRNEIIRALRDAARACGFALVAIQIGVDERQVSKWEEDGGCRPSDEYLVRAIIGLSSGFAEGDPDNVRFMLLAESILGLKPKSVGLNSFEQALDVLFEGMRDDAQSVIANRTGIHRNVVHCLLDYKPTGKLTAATMVLVLRAIIKKKYPEKIEIFDAASKEALRSFEQKHGNRQLYVVKPVFGRSDPHTSTPSSRETPQKITKKAQPRETQETAQPQREETGVVVVWLLLQIVELLKAVCKMNPDQRDTILRAADPRLVEMRNLFDAAGLEEPREYLKLLSQDRTASDVLSQR